MEEKTIKFDLSADTLLDMADARIDDGNYLSALRLLHKSLDLYGPAADEYASLADAYDEMELYEESADCWFRFLDICEEDELVDAYEGLAACFYNLGNEPAANYYYKKMLSDKYLSPSNNIEMGELFEKHPRTALRVAWPPESADYSEEIDAGLKALRRGDFEEAENRFASVHPQSEYGAAAMNYLTVTHLLAGEPEKAEKVCLKLLEKEPENVQALSTYAAVLTELDRPQDARAVAEKLAKLPAESADELYKIATVCCENKLYDEAYEKFCRLETMVGYDKTLLFFKAVAALRSGRVQECLASYGKILDIYPAAAVTRYYYRAVRTYAEEGGAVPETSFFYRIPREEKEARVNFLAALAKMKTSDLRAYCRESDLSELFEWCFDEGDGQDGDLQILGATVAARCGYNNFVCGLLLGGRVADGVKLETLRAVCMQNREFSCGIVLGNVYRSVDFARLNVGRKKHRLFLEAYASCFARFAVPGGQDGEAYRRAAEGLYTTLEARGLLSEVSDAGSVACAICMAVLGTDAKGTKRLLEALGADARLVARILSALRDAAAEAEAAAAAGTEDKGEAEKEDAKPETEGDKDDETH